jgi:hypothetical protein
VNPGVEPGELIRRFPRLYHMAANGSWESIAKHGLLSTSALLDLFEYRDARRYALEACPRPKSVVIEHRDYGHAVIRDQKPMSDSGLRRSLQGMVPEEWYRTLNNRVFFWLTRERLHRMLNAAAYRDQSHIVLTVDTSVLVDRHRERIVLSPMNTGATKPYPFPRGFDTFQRLASYPFADMLEKRGNRDPIVELAIDYSVPDIREMVLTVDCMKGQRILEAIFNSEQKVRGKGATNRGNNI